MPVNESNVDKGLKNKNNMATTIECDPSVTADPDVGLLAACSGPNERCVLDGVSSPGNFFISTYQ